MDEEGHHALGSDQSIIFFDGHCHMCSNMVQFVLRHNRNNRFLFAPLQGITASKYRAGVGYNWPDSIALLKDGRFYFKGDAVWRIADELGGFIGISSKLARIFPRFIRDGIYDYIAKRRFKWRAKKEVCYMPQPKWTDLFLP